MESDLHFYICLLFVQTKINVKASTIFLPELSLFYLIILHSF